MTISRNLSILAEGVSAAGVLAVTNGGTGVTTSTGTGSTVLSASPTLTGTLTVPTVTSAAATALTIQSAGTTAMTVDTSQNVGIGTGSGETIGATLEVRGAVGTALRIRSTLNSLEPTSYYSIGRDTDGLLKFNGAQTTFVGYKFFNTGSEVMRIDASGNLLVGTTAGGLSNSSSFTFQPSSQYSVFNKPSGSASGAYYIYFGYNAGTIGSITQNGTTGVLYNITSDQRLKTNIVDAPSATLVIDAIQIRSFDWRSDNSHNRYGVIAQELVQIAPEAVHVPVDEKDMMGVDYSKLVPILIKAFQELSAKNDVLEARLAKLETIQ